MISTTSAGQEYLVSASDLMASLIFVFIITLLIFVLRLQTVTISMQSAEDTQAVILSLVAKSLEENGLEVEIVPDQGILRLTSSSVNFAFGATDPIPEHVPRVELIGRVMLEVLPCFVNPPTDSTCEGLNVDRGRYTALLSTVLIEGHTDAAPVGTANRFRDNVELSGLRAASVHRVLRTSYPTIDSVLVRPGERRERILSISGYGAQRLIPDVDPLSETQRRIDLRFLMEPFQGVNPVPGVNPVTDAVRDQLGSSGG